MRKTSNKKINNQKSAQAKKGFTLLETLVAILLLSVSIAAAATIAQKALQSAEYSRDETTAYYLAAESIELVQNIRDGNSLNSRNWLASLAQNPSDPCSAADNNFCDIDSTSETPITSASCTFTTGSGYRLSINTNGQYGDCDLSGGTPTNFYRSITILPETLPGDSSPNEALVTATVSWNVGPFSMRTISLTETIFNWY